MTTLAVLEEIQKELSAASDADMRRAERTLGAQRDGEKPLGTIHNIEARRLWALANLFEARGMQGALIGSTVATPTRKLQTPHAWRCASEPSRSSRVNSFGSRRRRTLAARRGRATAASVCAPAGCSCRYRSRRCRRCSPGLLACDKGADAGYLAGAAPREPDCRVILV